MHHSRVPGPFWPKRASGRTPITTECCVLHRGLESGPREPKERKSAPARFLKALNKLGPKTEETKRCQNARKPRVLRGFLNTRVSRRRLSARLSLVFCGLVFDWPPARNRKTRPKTGLKVAVTLVWLLGPRGPPEGARRRPGAPKGTRNTMESVDFQKATIETLTTAKVEGPVPKVSVKVAPTPSPGR